jgi:hypothetical protein
MNTMAMATPFSNPSVKAGGRLTRDPNEYIGFPGEGGTVWGPDYFLDTI